MTSPKCLPCSTHSVQSDMIHSQTEYSPCPMDRVTVSFILDAILVYIVTIRSETLFTSATVLTGRASAQHTPLPSQLNLFSVSQGEEWLPVDCRSAWRNWHHLWTGQCQHARVLWLQLKDVCQLPQLQRFVALCCAPPSSAFGAQCAPNIAPAH